MTDEEQPEPEPERTDRTLYRFKIRLAQIEGGEMASVRDAVDQKQSAGELSVDWLMTMAALEIHHGRLDQAARLIADARAAKHPGLFADCVRDLFFQAAGKKHPTVEGALRLDFDPSTPAFVAPVR